MKIIEPSVELVNAPSYPNILSLIEQAGRTLSVKYPVFFEDIEV